MQKLFAVLALLPALLFAQIPELVQQYRQRIGGAADELNIVVRNYDEDSRRSGYDRASALGVMKKNSERLVREQGQRMEEYVVRLDRLNAQQSALANGVTLGAVVAVVLDYDQQAMSRAWDAYAVAIPMTVIGFIFAIIGWVAGYAALLLLAFIGRLRERASA